MKMCKAIPMFILLFTGYLCNNMNVAAETTPSHSFSPAETTPSHSFSPAETTPSHSFSPASKVTQAPESQTPPHGSDHVPEKHLSTLVAGTSISFVLLIILVITGVWYARKKTKGSLAEINSVPSGEPGVSLKRISTHENQHEWPLESALQ